MGIFGIIMGLLPPHITYWNGVLDSICVVSGAATLLFAIESIAKNKDKK